MTPNPGLIVMVLFRGEYLEKVHFMLNDCPVTDNSFT